VFEATAAAIDAANQVVTGALPAEVNTVLQMIQLVVLPLLFVVIRDVKRIGERVAHLEGVLQARRKTDSPEEP
jgi:hypothetical protein